VRPVVAVSLLVAAALIAFSLVELVSSGGGRRGDATLYAGEEIDISRLPGPQSEAAIAIDPRNPDVLLAGSNDGRGLTMLAYTSTDRGAHWTRAHLASPRRNGTCAMSDPSVAIDGRRRQFYAFVGIRCVSGRARSSLVYVARRAGPAGAWRIPPAVARQGRLTAADDHPMLVVDDNRSSPHRGRVYVAWTRFEVEPDAFVDPESEDVDLLEASALVSYSDDGGAHWSKPARLARGGRPLEVRLAVGPTGVVYATWRDAKTNSLYLASAADAATFEPRTFVGAAGVPNARRSCARSWTRIPAQPKRCVAPNPSVSVDTSGGPRSGRVYVTYGSTSLYGAQTVYIAAFAPDLRPLLGVGTPKLVSPAGGFRGPDAFLPASALDARNGDLWVCYYESGRGARRKIASYACRRSADGGETWSPQRTVARQPSDETLERADRANGYGDYEGVAVLDGLAHPIWTDGRNLKARGEEIYTAAVAAPSAIDRLEAVK
jgi:hypothetical protein